MMDAKQLGGMIATVVTPFDEHDQVDVSKIRAEVEYLLGTGVTAICACGSTGEGQTLSLEETAAIIREVASVVDGRVPVIAGVIQNSTAQAIRYCLAAKDAGADALQVTPVHYVFKPSAEEEVEHFRLIAEAAELPIVLYNVVPWALVQVESIARIAEEVPLVVAIKQSGGNIHLLAQLLANFRDRFRILAALDNLHYPAFVMGAHGALAAIPTVTPRLSVELWDAVQRGDHATALDLHEKILAVWTAIDGPNLPARIKAALALQGRDGGFPRKPFAPASAEERAEIEQALKVAGLVA